MKRRRELRYFEFPSKLGTLLVVLSERGLVGIAFDADLPSALELFGRPFHLEGPPVRVRGEPLAAELRRYFRGEPVAFGTPLDLGALSCFARRVLGALAGLKRGRTTTYGALAHRVGSPRAARAVGQVVAANPIPLVIACHRVLAADGSLGGYSGGLERKRALLALEGIRPPPGGWPCQKRREGRALGPRAGP